MAVGFVIMADKGKAMASSNVDITAGRCGITFRCVRIELFGTAKMGITLP